MIGDIKLSCPGPDIVCNECGIEMTNSIEGLVMMTLGTDQNNWMGVPGFDWSEIDSLNVNFNSANFIKTQIEEALSWLIELGYNIEVETKITGRSCICVTVRHDDIEVLCFDSVTGFSGVLRN